MTNQTASDILVDNLLDWGVEIIFGIPGDGINGIVESLRRRKDKIRFIQVQHEESAAFMACAWAKYTGETWSVHCDFRSRWHPSLKRSL